MSRARRRRADPSPWPRMIVASLCLLLLWFITHSGWLEQWLAAFMYVPSSSHAQKRADMILGSPECAHYKAELLKLSSVSADAAPPVTTIDQTYEAARVAGCSRPAQ